MKKIIHIFVLLCVPLFVCDVWIDRETTFSYFLENTSATYVQLLGAEFENELIDTLIDTTIAPSQSIQIYSGYSGFNAGHTLYTINAEKCDSILLFKDSTCISRSYNFRHEEILMRPDSVDPFYQFDNHTIWIPYRTINYDSDGPQPKEIIFKFTIN